MNLSTPTEFELERRRVICEGARRAYLRTRCDLAKKIKSVECLNPNAKLCYEYDRIFKITFEDDTSIEVSNDYVRHGLKPGHWVVTSGRGWSFMSNEDFLAKYEL